MEKLFEQLNRQVANFGVMYTKLHNYHWFVTGEKFFELHKKFEELYDEVTELMDEVAERILMLNGTPVATLKEFLEKATVKEASGKLSYRDMVKSVVDDFNLISKEVAETIKLAQDLGDEATVDMLIGITASLQKHVWMLTAYLK